MMKQTPGKTCRPVEGLTPEQCVKNCCLWEGLILQNFMGDCLPREGPHSGAGEECEESFPEEEGESETTCDELTIAPTPCPLCHCLGGGRELVSEVESGKKGGVGLRCFKNLGFIFSFSHSDLIHNKLSYFFPMLS